MKKAITLALVLVLALSLAACGGKDTGTGSTGGDSNTPSGSSTTNPPASTPSGNDTDAYPKGDGERWADSDLTAFAPKPDGTITDVDDDYGDPYGLDVNNKIATITMGWESQSERDDYIAKAKAAGYEESFDDGEKWIGRKEFTEGKYETDVTLTVEFFVSEYTGAGSSITIKASYFTN